MAIAHNRTLLSAANPGRVGKGRTRQRWSHLSLGQLAASRGYAVFFPNYRGSTGRGLDFAASAFGDPAGAEFEDIIDGVDHLIAEGLVDVDTYMAEPYTYWQFEVDREKATRNGVTVESINRNLAMVMGGHKLGDVKLGAPLEPTYIVIQAPLAMRSQVSRLSNLPIPTSEGQTIPLAELGRVVQMPADPYIFHKDLRPVEYVTGEMTGVLGAPIYGMFAVEDLLENYTAPDGVQITGMPWGLIGPPDNDLQSGFEWAGEWTVTYETFLYLCLAFAAALFLISTPAVALAASLAAPAAPGTRGSGTMGGRRSAGRRPFYVPVRRPLRHPAASAHATSARMPSATSSVRADPSSAPSPAPDEPSVPGWSESSATSHVSALARISAFPGSCSARSSRNIKELPKTTIFVSVLSSIFPGTSTNSAFLPFWTITGLPAKALCILPSIATASGKPVPDATRLTVSTASGGS